MLSGNIDRNDATYNTNAPFRWGCALRIGNISIPCGAVLSIKIELKEDMELPVRLSGISRGDRTDYKATFKDANGHIAGVWEFNKEQEQLPYASALLLDETSSVAGHIVYKPELASLLAAAVMLASSDEVRTSASDFILIDSCCIAAFNGVVRSVDVGGELHKADLCLQAGKYMNTEVTEGSGITVNVVGKYKNDAGSTGITTLHVNGEDYPVDGKHLLLTAGLTSNLRVTNAQEGGIVLKGVTDVTD